MGFFSSIGKAIKKTVGKVGDFFSDNAGGILSAAGDLASGLLGNSASADANAAEMELAREQIAYQKELAQNQIQWRVEDAKKAGLHPLAGLGVSSASYSPVSTDLTPADYSFLGDMGQNLNRAIMQGKTAKERQQALDRQNRLDDIMERKLNAEADLAESTAASERLRLHRELFPPMAKANDNSPLGAQPGVPYSLDTPYGKSLYHLFTVARHGDTLIETPHPDIADSITETEWKNILASIDAEAQAQDGTIKPPVYLLSPSEQEAVRNHRYELVRIPGVGWKLDRNPSRSHPYHDKLSKYEKFKRKNSQRWDGKQSVTGKIF